MGLFKVVESMLTNILPQIFVKHYVHPHTISQSQIPFDAKKFFESWYQAVICREFSDGITIFHQYDPLNSRYHYNLVENAIIEYFSSSCSSCSSPQVLDVGSGAGHWIDFYLDVFRARRVAGVDISGKCADALRQKYASLHNVQILETDISTSGFQMKDRFDIVNAIGVMFHIVEDDHWAQAISNLASCLSDIGVIVVSGQFGLITQNVQFHNCDEFSNWEETREIKSDVALVNKRIRSLSMWKKYIQQADLDVVAVHRTKKHKRISTPENNLIFLAHKKR